MGQTEWYQDVPTMAGRFVHLKVVVKRCNILQPIMFVFWVLPMGLSVALGKESILLCLLLVLHR